LIFSSLFTTSPSGAITTAAVVAAAVPTIINTSNYFLLSI